MAKRTPKKKLLVEGKDDIYVIAFLMEANDVPCPENIPSDFIEHMGGVGKLIPTISAELKVSDLETLGVVVDADENAQTRWEQIQSRCKEMFADIPSTLPQEGYIADSSGPLKKRLGIWIMPDNQSQGMLETFLTSLIPEKDDHVLEYAKTASTEAKKRGAPFKDPHYDKSVLHTWLAWQDPPGLQLGEAAKAKKIRAEESTHGTNFVKWFRDLFEV